VTELALKAEKMEDMSLKPFYTVLGVDLEGRKEILGLYLNEREGAKFWLQVLTGLNNQRKKKRCQVSNINLVSINM